MRYLLDTQIVIWAMIGSAQLSARALDEGLRLLSHDGKLPPYGDFVEHV